MIGFVLMVTLLFGGGTANACPNPSEGTANQPQASEQANSIPSNYLRLYQQAGQKYGIPWNVLAGIGKVETDHGTSDLPGVKSGENYAGAGGPMQFLQPTWDSYGVDGNGDGRKDRYDPEDAIPGAANYLKASGAPGDIRKAIFAYNHADWYVDDVLEWAKKYADGDFSVGGDNMAGSAACGSGPQAAGNYPPGTECPAGAAMGAENITDRMRCVRDQIKTLFKVPRGIGCYRSNGGIPGGGEHPLGRACDFMISSGAPTAEEAQLGNEIAAWAQANAKKLGIYYIIYRQRIWNPSRADEGWRLMEDRGSITQNHFDHVHISVDP
ncbi:lytic transglycosylase domain-containing protein [Actinomadura miaoliensis]|uniref:lytic transglycosylase domain-containing protein n=1 Tax=Actinomadura miaoliensis TaxID=430685 RepID=UPI0031F115CD